MPAHFFKQDRRKYGHLCENSVVRLNHGWQMDFVDKVFLYFFVP